MTGTLLPNAKQQFLSPAGTPLAGGSVYFYVPATTTPKNTWQDAGLTILNTNPITLDAAGEAIIYGSGQYRQVVFDVVGNLIWDQLTASAPIPLPPIPPPPVITNISQSASFSLGLGQGGNFYVCTDALSITMAATSTLSVNWIVYLFAVGGAITLTPNGSDLVNGNTVGGSPTQIPQGSFVTLTTDTLGNLYIAGFNSPVTGSFLNKFRNPSMDIAQRGTSGTITAGSPAYSLDGWIIGCSGANVTWVQSANFTAPNGFTYAHGMTITGASSVTDTFVKQRIEGQVSMGLSAQQCTFQATVTNGTGSPIVPTLTVNHASTLDNWGSPVTDVNAQTLQSVPSGATVTVSFTFIVSLSALNGLEIILDFGAALNSVAKLISVSAFDLRNTPYGPSSLNPSPPIPEIRPFSAELAINQRYFESSYDLGVPPGTVTAAGQLIFAINNMPSAAAYVGLLQGNYKVTKRITAPTLTLYSPSTGASGKIRDAGNSADITPTTIANGMSGFAVQGTMSGSNITFQLRAQYTSSAEL